MTSITQIARYRQSLILYAAKFGITKAARKYKVNRHWNPLWIVLTVRILTRISIRKKN